MTPMPPGLKLGLISPDAAIAEFAKRGLLQPSFRWQDVWQHEHAKAFAVAGVMKLDVLALIRKEVEQALAKGTTLEQFSKQLKPALVAKGFWGKVEVTDPATGELRTTTFNANRLATIFQTNIRQSQAAARWAGIERSAAVLPFVRYTTMDDAFVRASHAPWHGLVLPVADAFWHTHFPPNGWRCRCKAFAISAAMADALAKSGATLKRTAPPIDWVPFENKSTGEVHQVPRGIDPGFGYNPGLVKSAATVDLVLRKAAAAPALAAAAVLGESLAELRALPAARIERQAAFDAWLASQASAERPDTRLFALGHMSPQIVKALAARNRTPKSAVIAINRKSLTHTLRDAKGATRASPEQISSVLGIIVAPDAVLLNQVSGELLYVSVGELGELAGPTVKVVVLPDHIVGQQLAPAVGPQRGKVVVNLVRTVSVMRIDALLDATTYHVLWGKL